MHILTRAALIVACAFAPTAAMAGDARLGDLSIEGAWARASAGPAGAGAAYMHIANGGGGADRLVAASTPRAGKAELHEHVHQDGVMRMREVEGGMALAPGQHTMLEPGGLHVMLFGLTAPLKEGERFPLTLRFERAGEVTVEVDVKGVAAKAGEHKH